MAYEYGIILTQIQAVNVIYEPLKSKNMDTSGVFQTMEIQRTG